MEAFTPDGTPLGTAQAIHWARDDDKLPASSQTRAQLAATPIEEKESYRWLLSMRKAREIAALHPQTQIVYMADSEADIFEVIAEGMAAPRPLGFIIRACHDRALVDGSGEAKTAVDHLREEVLAGPVLYTHTIKIRGRDPKVACEVRGRRQPRESRTAEVEVRAVQVTLRAPWRKDRGLADVTVKAVLVTEVNPPGDDVPVEWLLLTTLSIDNIDQVRLVVEYYCTRWMVEIFFRTLKTGCRVEKRRFETMDGFLPCLAVYLIATWRTLYVVRLGRSCPEISCEAIFEPAEWKSVYQVVKGERPPKQPPMLQEMVRIVAQLGGYVSRERDDEPGPQTVWLGLRRMHDIALCWELFGPGAKERDGPLRLEAEVV
jgi:hypothetical protein